MLTISITMILGIALYGRDFVSTLIFSLGNLMINSI